MSRTPTTSAAACADLGYSLVEGWKGVTRGLGDDRKMTRLVVHLPPQDARRLWKVFVYMPGLKLLVYAPPVP